jgi:hypothetical protein
MASLEELADAHKRVAHKRVAHGRPPGITGVCTPRARAVPAARLTRRFMRFPRSQAGRDGRTWDRTRDLPRVKRALSR